MFLKKIWKWKRKNWKKKSYIGRVRFFAKIKACNFQMKSILPQNNFFPKNSFTLLLKYMVLTILLLASNAATHSIIFARKMEQICGLDTAVFFKKKKKSEKEICCHIEIVFCANIWRLLLLLCVQAICNNNWSQH